MASQDRKFRRKHGLYFFLADFRIITLVDKMHVKTDRKTSALRLRKLTATHGLKNMIAEELEKQAEKVRNCKDINAFGYLVEKNEAEVQVKNAKVQEESKENAEKNSTIQRELNEGEQ